VIGCLAGGVDMGVVSGTRQCGVGGVWLTVLFNHSRDGQMCSGVVKN
jgi:hypothetical protein